MLFTSSFKIRGNICEHLKIDNIEYIISTFKLEHFQLKSPMSDPGISAAEK